MGENGRLTIRNQRIAELFTDGKKLKSFYRFVSQNPNINLRDACQILILRPDATVCYSYEEWSAVGRQVKRGTKGIVYYDYDGYRQFVYDAADTRGENRAFRPIVPVEQLLSGLDELNGTDFANGEESDYNKIQNGVRFYLHEQDVLTGNEERDQLTIEGISISLYSKTSQPKEEEIALQPLPYTYSENAEFVKGVYIQSELLAQEIEDAYNSVQRQVEVIDDTDEEAVSDEPIVKAEEPPVAAESKAENQSVVPEKPKPVEEVKAEQPQVMPYYQKYLDAQKLNSQAVVVIRCGDFYEIMGENAKVIASELDLTLTGRNVGLPERVPMCGVPYHAMDKYLDKILANHGVIVVDGENEPVYIASHAEALGGKEVKTQKPIPVGVPDDEPNPFDNDLSEDDLRDDFESELSDIEEPEVEDEEIDGEYSSTNKEKIKPVPKKPEKGIKDRKRKEKPQLTLFDLDKPQEESREEKLIKHELRKGSHIQDGKIRIFDKYNDNPSVTSFAEFLKNEYGIGGSYVNETKESHGAKGISISWADKEHPENNISVHLKWNEVAVRIAELIEDDNYLTAEEKQEYDRVIRFREARDKATTDAERCDVIADQIVEYGTQKTSWETFAEYPHFLENYAKFFFEHTDEINERLLKRDEVSGVKRSDDLFHREINVSFRIKYCPRWQERLRRALQREHRVQDFANSFIESCAEQYSKSGERSIEWIVTPEEVGEIDYLFIKDNRDIFVEYLQNKIGVQKAEFSMQKITMVFDRDYIAGIADGSIMPPSEQSRKIREIAYKVIKDGTENTSEGNWITLYEDLKENEQFAHEHAEEIAVELEKHQEVSDVIVTPDSLDTNFYTDYCPNHEDDEVFEERKEPFSRFKNLTAAEQAFFNEYTQKPIREPRESLWGEVETCRTIANGIYEVTTARHGGVMISTELAPHVLSYEAIRKGVRDGGYYCYEEDCDASLPLRELYDKGILTPRHDYFTHYYVKSQRPEAVNGSVLFNQATDEEKAEYFKWWNSAINESLKNWNEEYWQAHEQGELSVEKESANTNLSGVLDQSELGGAKTRFKNNVAAIRLVNKLYEENRNATAEEKKVLAQFVGWGGLSQAFDENNPQWEKEYAELKGLLSQEDYEQARSSTLNAYYTAKEVIGGIYQALARFGVKGNNRILEPSMGTGNFFGFMPQEIAEGARLYGVELDNLTGRIAAKLYPQANVQIKGFEDTSFPNDKFDIVVGNVPFGGYGIADSDYNRYNFKVHDYFLAKSIDKVKPNGIVAIVTSKGTMDKLNPSARKYVAERAELLGAIRLPNTAFKQTAGTEAVADILFFRKRTERINTAEEKIEWLGTGKTEEGYEINQYFINHPEMVLGTLAEETGLYGGVDVTVKSDGRELSQALAEAIKNLPQGMYLNPEQPPEEERVTEVDYSVKPMCYKAENGRLYMRIGEEMVEQSIPSFPKDAYRRIQGMIDLRDELHHILDIQIQGCSDETLQDEQRKLNAQYDNFVRQYGNLSSQTNTRLFRDDGDSALLFACEEVNEETQAVKKADIFNKRTIRPYTVPTNTDDCFEALQISKNERGWVDVAYIEELTGKDYDTVIAELGNAVFRDPDLIDEEDKYSGFVTAEEYLSGKVVAKLSSAQRYAAEHPEYEKNVNALTGVQPQPITASEISVRLGQTWVGKEVYKEFYLELIDAYWYMKRDVELYYNPHDSSWRIDQKDSVRRDTRMKQTEVYGTKRAPAYRLFIDCMNGRDTNIYDTIEEDGKEKRVLNQAETIAAREKQNKIKEEFKNWIFADPERREALERKYNAIFNQTRLPSYDGSYLRFPEMSPAIELNPHQKNAVHRIITSDGSTLLHHVVGSGKTFTIIASVMKMRQLGLCKKAMVTVPNHLVEQWAGEWRKLYPNANILVATKEDLEKDNRQKFVSKVALGDWDGIIIAQSAFAKIPISKARQVRKLNEEIENVRLTLESRKKDSGLAGGSVKNLERIIKNKEKQLKTLMSDEKKDGVLIFENLGVDYLYVDEAHYYKNLFLFTKMNNVAGISNAASQRASDLKLKCEYIQELHGSDKGVVFATGTPISNSMTEMYTMQTYLQPTELRDHGIMFFDGWAADFGETVTSMELSPSGQGYRTRTRFSKFTNLPELQKMYRSFADVITSDMVKLDVPEAERKVITLKPSDAVIDLAQEIAERADRIYEGGVDPHEDNMLKVTSDGKKLALDPRCLVPSTLDEEGSKLNICADYISEGYRDTANLRGTQLVFCDLSTPKKKFEDYVYGTDFDAYNDLKYKLVQRGIPAEEIAYIHDAATDEQKQTLFDKVNSGAVRVLIGSTEKCGAGTNVQKRLAALHNLDTPYRPSDLEQRIGRGIRQGNIFDVVKIFTYVKERTFDSYSYQILENKQRFISQVCKGDFTAREFEDVDATTLSYAEIKAITAANPRIKRKMEVDTEIIRLRVLEGQYKKNLFALQDKIRKDFPEEIRKQELLIERVREDIQAANANRSAPDMFRINVNGTEYADKKEGGRALMDALYASKPNTPVAEYCGFKISIMPLSVLGGDREIALTGVGQYTLFIGDSASGNLTRIENFLEDLPARKERLEKRLTQIKSDMAIAESQVRKPFDHAEELTELLKEQAELNAELNLDKREQVIMDDGNGGEDEGNFMSVPIDKKAIMEVNIIDEEEERIKDAFAARAVLNQALEAYSKEEIEEMNLPAFDDKLTVIGKEEERHVKENGGDEVVLTELMLLRNEVTGDYYVISDTSVKNADGNGIEVGDVTDVKTVLAYDGLFEGNPFQVFHDENTARRYFDGTVQANRRVLANSSDYRTAVINSVILEYDEFKADMTKKPAGEVFNENYKIGAYNSFASVIEDTEEYFTEEDYKALYEERGHIIGSLYDELLKSGGYTVEDYDETVQFIKDHCKRFHSELYNQNPPIYLQTARYANEHNEMEKYRGSHRLNEDCKHTIDEAIRNNFDGMHLKNGFEDKLVEKFGMDRVAFIVATTINEHGWDGRYSRENKEWAKSIPMSESEDERGYCCLNIHPAVLNGFTDMIRKRIKEKEEMEEASKKVPELVETLKQFAESEDYKKPKAYYTFIYERLAGGSGQYQAYMLDEGDDEIYALFEKGFSTEEELERKFQGLVDSGVFAPLELIKCEPHEQLKISNQNKKIKEKQKAMSEEQEGKYSKVTPQGHKVLSMIKDRDNRNIAILYRENVGDYVVAARYDPKDGKWAQGTYDFQTVEDAEKYREKRYGKNAPGAVIEEVKPARNWLFAHVAREALIAKHEYSSFMRMPTTSEYAGYGYSIYNNRIKNGKQLVDLQSDTRELCYDIRLDENETVKLSHANGDEKSLTAREFIELVSGTTSKDYEQKPRIEISIPREAKGNVYDNSIMFALPNTVSGDKYTYFIPSRFVSDGEGYDEGRIILSIPEDFTVKAQNFDGDEMEYSAQEFFDLCHGTREEDYYFEGDEEADEDEKKTWFYVSVDKAARIAQYDNSTLFKMPKGEYEGYTYYIPNGFLKENEEQGTIRIGLPEDFVVKPKDNRTGDEISMGTAEFSEQVKNKKANAYRYFQRPSEEAKRQFDLKEKMLRKNIPPEMQERKNWVAIATFEKENGKLGKRPIDCNTGKFASDNDPETWTDFESACKFARENGCATIAYALDGQDNIACIDLDHCVEENGDYSELASKTFKFGNGTYCERSLSGQGLHVFGKTDGMDLRSFSKDGDMEFYRKSRFIAMTGDYYGSKALKSFDTPEMKSLLESKFDKRAPITNAGKGIEGLSQMADREVYDKACASYNGERFKALFEGQDLQNNHSNSDMSLMHYLAFWCNGDKEQMIRMFSSSGLFRRSKSPDYYECTAIKAIETTAERYTPKPKAQPKNPSNGNGKR